MTKFTVAVLLGLVVKKVRVVSEAHGKLFLSSKNKTILFKFMEPKVEGGGILHDATTSCQIIKENATLCNWHVEENKVSVAI